MKKEPDPEDQDPIAKCINCQNLYCQECSWLRGEHDVVRYCSQKCEDQYERKKRGSPDKARKGSYAR